ncbi:MAG: peptidyl-prolyl cis-trans isomerase [Gammaproteobacteria bacterium]
MRAGKMRRWVQSPVLHFVAIGAVLFAVSALRSTPAPEREEVEREPILISGEQIRLMRADFAKRWGTMPDPEQLTALINQAIDDELLYREARALALDFEDGSVRRRLVEKMRAVSDHPGRSEEDLYREARALGLDDDVVIRRLLIAKMRLFLQQDLHGAPPAEKDLQGYLDRHRERFMQPAAVTFSQVFLGAATHGDHPERDAHAVLAKLGTRSPSAEIVSELSDPFPLGLEFPAYSRSRIASRFGKSFADRVFDCEKGSWCGPIASPYGLHWVFVHEKSPERMPPLAAVRKRIVHAVTAERAAVQLARGLARLRTLREIRVEGREDLSVPDRTLAAKP